MSTPRADPRSYWQRVSQRWSDVEAVLTDSPLGLMDQLQSMVEWIGCDCVLLVSSRRSLGQMKDAAWLWRIHRAFPAQYTWLVTHNHQERGIALKPLFEKFGFVAEAAQRAPTATYLPDDKAKDGPRVYVYNDWGCQSPKSVARCARETALWDLGFMLPKEGKDAIRVSNGEMVHLVTHVGLMLLGSVSIGKWELGESYLVFLDVEEERNSLRAPKKWCDTVKEDCIPFLAYLSEVNSHFDRLFGLNRLRPMERMRRIPDMTEVERYAYCRSATRLAPLLGADLPATIETLVQLEAYWADCQKVLEKKKGDTFEDGVLEDDTRKAFQAIDQQIHETTRGQQGIRIALDLFASRSYPVLRDGHRMVPVEEAERRGAYIRRQAAWTGIWWRLERLQQKAHHHNGDTYGQWSSELPGVLRDLMQHLAASPAETWFRLGVDDGGTLSLDGPCLAGFLVYWIVVHCKDRLDPILLGLAGHSDPRGFEVLTFARQFVCAIRYALGCITADEDVLRALLWLLSEIGHTRFGVDRRLDFEKHLRLAALEQPALYGLKPFYRDHLNHVIQVCLTGWLLLETRIRPPNRPEDDIARHFLKPKQSYEALVGQWFVAALLHDVGYVIDIGTGWADLLDKFEDPVVMGDLSARARKTIGEWAEHADRWSAWGYRAQDRPGEDHGVVSAMHVQSAIEALTNSSAAGFTEALLAIAHHNHPKATVQFKDEPLSVLLVVCDELQEWDRRWLDLERAALALSTIAAFNPAYSPRWHEPLSRVATNLRIVPNAGDPTQATIEIAGYVLEFSIRYSADIHRNHSVFNAWLGRTCNLQRIALGDEQVCPLDIRYRMKSAVAPPTGFAARDATEPELARLWRIARDQRAWSIHAWLDAASSSAALPPSGSGTTMQGVMYEIGDGGKTETVLLDVRRLGDVKTVVCDIAEFWKKVGNWRYAGESLEEPS